MAATGVSNVHFQGVFTLKITFRAKLSLHTRVSQKTKKSEFCFATNPTGFHRLDEPLEKFSAL